MTPRVHKIALLGARAVGKTTLGRALAAQLRWAFVDTDEALAARTGMHANAFLAQRGVSAFRTVEAAVVLEALARAEPTVVALGGGAVTIAAVRVALKDPVVLPVLLVAPLAVLVERQTQNPRAPLTDLPLAEEVAALTERRRAAHDEVVRVTLDTSTASVEACCKDLVGKITTALAKPTGERG